MLLKNRIEHRDFIINKVQVRLEKHDACTDLKVEFYNSRRFKFNYKSLNNYNKTSVQNIISGYPSIVSCYVSHGIDGIYFFASRYQEFKFQGEKLTGMLLGVVPYEDILWVDEDGDDTTTRMIFYLKTPLFRFPKFN